MNDSESIHTDGASHHDWSHCTFGAQVHRLLSDSAIPWARWGPAEPHKNAFAPASSEPFIKTWQEKLSRAFGSIGVDVGTDGCTISFAMTHGPYPRASQFWLTCPSAQWSAEHRNVLRLSTNLYRALSCFHGWNGHRQEYHAQHYSRQYMAKYGGEAVVMLGVGYKDCLPGVYWGNLFGPPVTQWIGEDRIRSCPCHEHREFASGYHLLIAYPDVHAHGTPEAMAAKDAIRAHLGVEKFFDRRFPDRELMAPPLDWSELYRPAPKMEPEEAAAKLEELKQKAREMGGWLETRPGQIRLHLDGTDEPDPDGKTPGAKDA